MARKNVYRKIETLGRFLDLVIKTLAALNAHKIKTHYIPINNKVSVKVSELCK